MTSYPSSLCSSSRAYHKSLLSLSNTFVLFFCLFVFIFLFETGSYVIARDGLDLRYPTSASQFRAFPDLYVVPPGQLWGLLSLFPKSGPNSN